MISLSLLFFQHFSIVNSYLESFYQLSLSFFVDHFFVSLRQSSQRVAKRIFLVFCFLLVLLKRKRNTKELRRRNDFLLLQLGMGVIHAYFFQQTRYLVEGILSKFVNLNAVLRHVSERQRLIPF